MNFRQYTVPVYGGYIGIATDTELYNRLQSYDAGLPLCEYGTLVDEIFLSANGLELQEIFKDRSVKFATWSWGPKSGSAMRTLEDKFKNPLQSVFTSSQFQVAFGQLMDTTAEVARPLAAKTGATAPTIYTQETNRGVVYVDIETPPSRQMMGGLTSSNDGERTYDSTITGLIVQTEDGTGQLFLSVVVEVSSTSTISPIYPGLISSPPYYIRSYRQTVSALEPEAVNDITDNAIAESSEPYGEGENPNPDGGNGSQDDESDEVEEPETPDLSAVDTGFCSIYAPTKAQLNELSSYIWSEDWWDIVDNLRNMILNPMTAIMSLIIVPVTPDTVGLRNLKLGRWDTGIRMPPVTNQFTMVDCGEVFVQPYYNTFLDYQPNTSIDIYLPFIGSRPLDPDVVTGRTVGVKYMFDVVTGFCVAFITVNGSVYYTFNGQCSITLPITQLTHANMVGSTLSALSTLVTMKHTPTVQAFQVPDLINSAVNAPKQSIDKAGNISGNVGYMANRTPYLTITRPNLIVNPEGGRQKLLGYPCEQFYRLGDLRGFTVVEDIQLKDIPAPQNVISDIENQLRRGVIL